MDDYADAPTKETKPVSGEADWETFQHNVAYHAETDGIVSAFSGGDGVVTEGLIFEGASQGTLEIRTRFGRYDGAVLPVRQGRYWLVQYESSDEQTIEVQWLPLPSGR